MLYLFKINKINKINAFKRSEGKSKKNEKKIDIQNFNSFLNEVRKMKLEN